ncbi:MAG: aspartate aminotransferase family protein, partial [Thermoleophilia bacterium]|nr:aspartate aminotransferase family protein [Thermoleophilia bacterium]
GGGGGARAGPLPPGGAPPRPPPAPPPPPPTLAALAAPGVWDELERRGAQLEEGLAELGGRVQVARVGTMLGLFFSDAPVTCWDEARQADTERYAGFHRALLERGVYLAPSQFEAAFLSTAHGEEEIEATLEAAAGALAAIG